MLPRGVVEDVMIKVGEFISLVDFIVLETEKVTNTTNQVSIILRHPFLATINAFNNYRNGMMKLSLGNMTMELNILISKDNLRDLMIQCFLLWIR